MIENHRKAREVMEGLGKQGESSLLTDSLLSMFQLGFLHYQKKNSMSSLLLSRLSRLSLNKPPALGVRRYLCGARFLSETPVYQIIRADHCQCSSRNDSVGRLVVRNVKAPRFRDKEVLEKMVPMHLMTATGTIGASHGWVATLDDYEVCLQDDLNPFASDSDPKRISLERPEALPHCQTQLVTNVAMSSSSPDDEDGDCILAIKFVGPQLSLCRRPAQWNSQWVNIRIEDPGFFSSRVMYSKKEKMFSMVGCGGTHTGSWDLEKHTSRSLDYRQYKEYLPSEMYDMSSTYSRSEHLVESPTGETFMVKWYTKSIGWQGSDHGVPYSKRFMVFKVEGDAAIATDDIEDLCIFLSTKGEPFCVEASLYGLTPNCIYFVSDFDYGRYDIGKNGGVFGFGFSPAPYFIPPQSS